MKTLAVIAYIVLILWGIHKLTAAKEKQPAADSLCVDKSQKSDEINNDSSEQNRKELKTAISNGIIKTKINKNAQAAHKYGSQAYNERIAKGEFSHLCTLPTEITARQIPKTIICVSPIYTENSVRYAIKVRTPCSLICL